MTRDDDGREEVAQSERQLRTALAAAEQALRASEERYRELIESQGEGIGIVDDQERFTFANPAAGRIFGLPAQELLGRSLREFIDPDQFARVLEQTNQRQQGQQSTYELVFHPADLPAQRQIMLVTAAPRTDEQGRYLGAFGVFRDITERKQMEDALGEKEERYRQLIESLPHGVAVLQDLGIVFANAAAIRMLGCESLEQLRTLSPLEILVPEERARVLGLLEGIRAGTASGPLPYITRVPEEKRPRETPPTPVAGLRFDETVLVVEDDEVVRQQVCRILERQGFTVLAAGDGDEGLEVAAQHHGLINLLLTDVIMPRMNGRELYRRLAEQRPDTRVIYMSGYADEVIADHGVLVEGIHFVQKPFSVQELINKIIDALEL